MIHSVSSLSRDARSLVESLVGHPLPDDEAFAIVTVGSRGDGGRDEAWDELEVMMAEMRRNASASRMADAAVEKLIDDTCDDVRYGRAS